MFNLEWNKYVLELSNQEYKGKLLECQEAIRTLNDEKFLDTLSSYELFGFELIGEVL